MSGLLPSPTGAGGGDDEASNSRAISEEIGAGSPSKANRPSDRKHVFGTPTSQLSNSTEISRQGEPGDNRPSVSDMGMSPVRDSIGKLVHSQKEGPRFSEDAQRGGRNNSPSSQKAAQLGKEGVFQEECEGKKKNRWDSARAKFGNVLSVGHNIRGSLSRSRRSSIDPRVDHLMNDLNSRESVSRADIKAPSPHESGHQSPPPPNPTAATSLTGSTHPARSSQASIGALANASPSRFSSRFASWRSNRKERGRESPQEQEETIGLSTDEQFRSASSPPSQRFRIRVNRFLRSGRRSMSSTASPTSGAAAAPGSEPEHLESLTSTPAQTPPYLSSAESSTVRGSPRRGSGFRKAMRRGVTSARRRVSAPFLSTPSRSEDVSPSGAEAIEPPERPQTVPLEKRRGPLRSPGRSQFVLSSKPGHDFLPSEATNVIPNYSAPPVITENPEPEEWLEEDFEGISMIQSRPPMFPPGIEESPPVSPWVKAADGNKEWMRLTPASPMLPEIASVAPFVADELMTRDYATAKAPGGGQDVPDIYWAVASGSGTNRIDEGQAIDKGKEKFALSTTDHLKPPENNHHLEDTSGKSIEVLEEEKRRKSRDTGIMGLDPEVTYRSDPPISGPGEGDDDGEFTYASAMREIAGLDRFPKRPPPDDNNNDDDANLDDVSVPLPECDYDLPLPNFRFSMLAEPSPSSNEPDASPCTASTSSTQGTSSSAPAFVGLTSVHTTALTTTTATTRTTTAASTTPSASASISPPNLSPYHYQMLLSSKRPYMFVLQEISSGTYVKITPKNNSSPVSRSMSTVSQSYPQTPTPSQTSPGPARSPVSVRFVNCNGLLACGVEAQEEGEGEEEKEEGGGGRGGRGGGDGSDGDGGGGCGDAEGGEVRRGRRGGNGKEKEK